MTTPAGHDYDRVAYPAMAHSQTFTDLLSIRGYLRGLDVAPPAACRVLELGCGDGMNLAAMAALHPGARYTGVDYSAEAIERGRGLLRGLGYENIRLEAADIRALAELVPALGEFDYIVAHGVYSWVPPDVRDALLATIGRMLAPHGVGFVSYLALPGAYHREAVRSIMRFHTRGEKDPAAQVRQARAILGIIAHGSAEPNHYTQWMASELDLVSGRAPEALYHDELSAVSAPVLFTEFVGHAGRHGLQFVSEAEYLLSVAPALTPEAREQLRPLEANRVLLEQYLDFMEGRRFRQTLLCRADRELRLRPDRFDHLWVSYQGEVGPGSAALADPAMLEFKRPNSSTHIRAGKPMEKALLLTLAARAGEALPFPDLVAEIRERLGREGVTPDADFDAAVRRYLGHTALPGLVELTWSQRAWAVRAPARPRAHPLALWVARHDPTRALLSYTGRYVDVSGALGQHLLTLVDGTRDRAALLAGIRDFLAAHHAAAQSRGETSELPPPDAAELPEQLENGLTTLAALGLFRRE